MIACKDSKCDVKYERRREDIKSTALKGRKADELAQHMTCSNVSPTLLCLTRFSRLRLELRLLCVLLGDSLALHLPQLLLLLLPQLLLLLLLHRLLFFKIIIIALWCNRIELNEHAIKLERRECTGGHDKTVM